MRPSSSGRRRASRRPNCRRKKLGVTSHDGVDHVGHRLDRRRPRDDGGVARRDQRRTTERLSSACGKPIEKVFMRWWLRGDVAPTIVEPSTPPRGRRRSGCSDMQRRPTADESDVSSSASGVSTRGRCRRGPAREALDPRRQPAPATACRRNFGACPTYAERGEIGTICRARYSSIAAVVELRRLVSGNRQQRVPRRQGDAVRQPRQNTPSSGADRRVSRSRSRARSNSEKANILYRRLTERLLAPRTDAGSPAVAPRAGNARPLATSSGRSPRSWTPRPLATSETPPSSSSIAGSASGERSMIELERRPSVQRRALAQTLTG